MKKSGASKLEGMNCAKRLERRRAITTLEVEFEFEGGLQVTLSHRQQLEELEFHESKVCNEE